jgi:hypothetical protein
VLFRSCDRMNKKIELDDELQKTKMCVGMEPGDL